MKPMIVNGPIVVAALYKFVRLEDYAAKQTPLLAEMQAHDVRGSLLLAREGINGTISGTRAGIDAVLAWLKADPRLAELEHKESYADQQPFFRSKVKLKREIVTMGVDGVDPNEVVGTYVDPQDWNALIRDPDVVLIDTRNDYEVRIGTFQGAIDPVMRTFREFPAYVAEHFDPAAHKKVAMFCTGGIRCEKASAFMKQAGFDEVYHLKGGILKYLEEVPPDESLWQGECFVFDQRVSVTHGLAEGEAELCYGCRGSVTPADKHSEKYIENLCCPRCFDQLNEDQRQRFAERKKQIELAQQRGEMHVGSSPRC